jgi:hypothetical protein
MYFLIYDQPKCSTVIFSVGALTDILNLFIITRVYATCVIHLFHFYLIIQKILRYKQKSAVGCLFSVRFIH